MLVGKESIAFDVMYLNKVLISNWDAKSRTFAIIRIQIRVTYFDLCFSCRGSAAVFRNLTRSAQDTSTRLQAV